MLDAVLLQGEQHLCPLYAVKSIVCRLDIVMFELCFQMCQFVLHMWSGELS